MSRIAHAFYAKKALIAHVVCGAPNLQRTRQLIDTMAQAGVDLIALELPFSDPTVQEPAIASAHACGLEQEIAPLQVFELVRQVRQDLAIPLVLVSYANVIFAYGIPAFMKQAAQAGVDGLLVPDVPMEERDEFEPVCQKYGVDWIVQVAPTSGSRVNAIVDGAQGFVCCTVGRDLDNMLASVQAATTLPAVIDAEEMEDTQLAELSKLADGVIVGSAIMRQVMQHPWDNSSSVETYIRKIRRIVEL